MKHRRSSQSGRAFTLIELLFAMTILGIVLGLTVAEFTAAIQNFRFQDAHLDAETQARIAMARINDATKMATPDIEDTPCLQSNTCSVIPGAGALQNVTDGNTAVSFYVVTSDAGTSGHLSKTMPVNGAHEPVPVYNVETIFYNPPNLLQECTETLAQYNSEPNPLTVPCQNSTTGTQTLIHNVDGAANVPFGVTPLGCNVTDTSCSDKVLGLQIDISVVNQSTQVVGNTGSSTSGGVAEHAYVSNEIYFSSWKAFH